MAFRPLLRHRAVLPATASILTAGTVFYPLTSAHAEAPPEFLSKKPIYDDFPPAPQKEPSLPSSTPPSSASRSPTATDRLAVHIRASRLYLHDKAAAGEEQLNAFLTSLFHLEHSFTQTIVSLAPPRESGERLVPGVIYVLVAAMTGSIISRNRNILLRAAVPAALGLGAGYVVLPITMRNVGNLVWSYEERVPVIRENHLRIQGATEEGWRQVRARSQAGVRFVDAHVQSGRKAVQEWVKKGN